MSKAEKMFEKYMFHRVLSWESLQDVKSIHTIMANKNLKEALQELEQEMLEEQKELIETIQVEQCQNCNDIMEKWLNELKDKINS